MFRSNDVRNLLAEIFMHFLKLGFSLRCKILMDIKKVVSVIKYENQHLKGFDSFKFNDFR